MGTNINITWSPGAAYGGVRQPAVSLATLYLSNGGILNSVLCSFIHIHLVPQYVDNRERESLFPGLHTSDCMCKHRGNTELVDLSQ